MTKGSAHVAQWYLGRPVEGTHTGTNFGTPWMEKEGTSNVVMKFESGALGYHFGTWGAKGTRLGYAVHAHGTEGMLELDFAGGRIVLHADPTGGDLPALLAKYGVHPEGSREMILCESEGGKPTNRELEHFLDCVESGAAPETNGRQSLQSLRVIWRMYDAEERGVVADLRGLGLDQFTGGEVC
jgi:predicted dehydrogenase